MAGSVVRDNNWRRTCITLRTVLTHFESTVFPLPTESEPHSEIDYSLKYSITFYNYLRPDAVGLVSRGTHEIALKRLKPFSRMNCWSRQHWLLCMQFPVCCAAPLKNNCE